MRWIAMGVIVLLPVMVFAAQTPDANGELAGCITDRSGQLLPGVTVELRSGPYFAGLTNRTYDVSSDGQRFLMIKAAGSAVNNTPRIIVVENWFEELKRLVPTKR